MTKTNKKLLRLFIGIPLHKKTNPEINNCLNNLRNMAQKGNFPFRWIPEEDLHITLKFLGSTEESKIPLIKQTLAEISKNYSSFSLKIKGVTAFPQLLKSRTICFLTNKKFESIMQNYFSTYNAVEEIDLAH